MPDEDFPRVERRAAAPQGLLARVLGFAIGTLALVASLLFSVAVFAVLLAAGAIVGGYLWWRTRALRRQLREQMQSMHEQLRARQAEADAARQGARDPTVIEGDFIRETGREPRPPEP